MKALRCSRPALCALLAAVMVNAAAALESDQLSRDDLANLGAPGSRFAGSKVTTNSKTIFGLLQRFGQAHARHGLFGVDTLLNWNDHYFADGFDPNGNPNREWFTNTAGNPPWQGGTTLINTPIVPVIMDLRNEDGSPRFVNGQPLVSSPDAFIAPILNSPVFAFSNWSSSSVPTQLIDAMQRASYFSKAKDDWHTLLVPSVKTARRLVLNKGSYLFALNEDGSCCAVILVETQPVLDAIFAVRSTDPSTTIMGAAAAAGDITTKDISILLFNNVFLLDFGNPPRNLIPGFHSFDFQEPNKLYVMGFVSWFSPGLFPPPFDRPDVAILSHELAEIVNNPFIGADGIHDVTPWWLAPNGFCLDFLEVADGVEHLPNFMYPISMNGMTYHPENVVLVPWFKRESPSSALHNAYSYPDESVITQLSPPEKANCQ
jgi:hypothetical protein